jgi:hypothetical protein
MTSNDAFDRTITGWLKSDAESHQPVVRLDRVHDAVRRHRPRPALLAALGSRWVGGALGAREGGVPSALGRLSPAALLMLLAALVIAAGTALVAGQVPAIAPPTVTPSSTTAGEPSLGPAAYEAIFLRLEVVDGRPDVIVTAVGEAGRQRQVARLRHAWLVYDPISPSASEFLPPMGTVSSTGLLAMLGSKGEPQNEACDRRCGTAHWEIFDLHDPDVPPIVVPEIHGFFEGIPGPASWGPGDQVMFRYPGGGPRVMFVDGRTGQASSVWIQVKNPGIEGWTADGAGILVTNNTTERVVVHPDGSVSTGPAAPAAPHCQMRYRSGAQLVIRDELGGRVFLQQDRAIGMTEWSAHGHVGAACIAPDESMVLLTSGSLQSRLVIGEAEIVLDNLGTFAGWMAFGD